MTPEQSSVFEPIQTLLKNWDINRTEALLLRIEEEKSRRRNEDRQRNEAETGKIENQIAEAEKAYKSLQQKVIKHEHNIAAFELAQKQMSQPIISHR